MLLNKEKSNKMFCPAKTYVCVCVCVWNVAQKQTHKT